MRRARFLTALLFAAVVPLGFARAAGVLYLSPQGAREEMGQPFTVTVLANAGDTSVSAVEATLSYDPHALAVDRLSIDNSVLQSWATTPSYDSASGEIHFSGWAAKNFSGDKNTLLTITFVPLRVSEDEVQFTSGAMLDAT